MTFKVDRTPAVNQQMRVLAKLAKARRIHQAYSAKQTVIIYDIRALPNSPLAES
jgi:hypothetical protein